MDGKTTVAVGSQEHFIPFIQSPQKYPFILVLSGEHDKTLLFLIVWHEQKYSQASNLRGGEEKDEDHPSSLRAAW